MPPVTAPLPICVLKKGMPRAPHELREQRARQRGRLAAAPSMISGRFAARIIAAVAIERRRRGDRPSRSDAAAPADGLGLLVGDIFGQLEMHRAGPLFLGDAEGLAHEGGDGGGETIWRVILVSGLIAATMSTIWKRACRAVMIAFWPVIISIGMAPRWA